MAPVQRWILICGILLLATPRLLFAGEDADFKVASKKFTDGFYDLADKDFAEFIQKYPNSPHLPDALVFQAESRIKLTNYAGALQLLAAYQNQAGKRADEFLFWMADAQFQKGEFQAAGDSFAKLIQQFPASTRRLEASIGEAAARSQLGQWPRVVELLRSTNGVFQSTAQTSPANTNLVRGYLLLSEALLEQNDLAGAEAALQPLSSRPVGPASLWQRQYLLCRIALAGGHADSAAQNVTNLLDLAVQSGQPALQAETIAFQAGLLERLGQTNDAIAVYRKNLAETVNTDRRRDALLRITALFVAQNRVADAAQTLNEFVQKYPTGETAALGLLRLGELYLEQHLTGTCTNLIAPVATNAAPADCLALALTNLQAFVTRFPQSALLGRAQLALGRCYFLQQKWPESHSALEAAASQLPPRSLDQAMAYFKLAEVELRQSRFTAALTNLQIVLDKFADVPQVQTNLVEPALYQTVQAALKAGDKPAGTNALARLLASYPKGSFTDNAVLLTAQAFTPTDPAWARQLLFDRVKQAPTSVSLPDLQLGIAATYEQDRQWTNVIGQYNAWLSVYTNHPAFPRALYARAWAYDQAGQSTNALAGFTHFPEQFPASDLAPLARWWVAGYYLGKSDFYEAERNYKLVYEQWPTSKLAYPAHLRAAHAALLREQPSNAKQCLDPLLNDTNCPPDLRAQAWYALGDTFLSRGSTNKLDDLTQAINAYDRVYLLFPSNRLAALALGARANCLLQTAQTPEDYDSVSNTFRRVVEFPSADPQARSIGKLGLGLTMEKLAEGKSEAERSALLDVALREYTDVFYGGYLRGNEQPDIFSTRKAGLEAARVAEARNQLDQAIRVYERLREIFPAAELTQKISALKAKQQRIANQ